MEFKYDTKPTYIVITPVTDCIDANMTEQLRLKISELSRDEGNNYIIDLQNCAMADTSAFDNWAALHEECYGNEQSLVFTKLTPDVEKVIRGTEVIHSINLAPSMQEAIDIVSMEILERDLLGEDDL